MPLRNPFHSYFYGKPGQRDFTAADLPRNRRQLFHQVLGVRRGNLVGLNLLYLLIWLPAVFWTFLNLLQLNQLDTLGAGFLDQLLYSWLLLLFPLIAITGPCNMGASFVLRNWARDEHSFPYADFKAAMIANWKQGLLFSAIDGFVPLLTYVCLRFYRQMAVQSALFYLPMALLLIAALLWWLTAPILPTMIVTYRQGFGGLLRNGLIMTFAALPRSLGLRLLTSALPIAALICAGIFPTALNWLLPLTLILYALFLLAFNKLIWASHANALCEKYLNPKIEGAQVNIGLRPEDDGK